MNGSDRLVWLGVVVGILAGGGVHAKAEIIMSEATCVDQVINNGTNTQECSFLHDGLKLYFSHSLPGGHGGLRDIWVASREAQDAPWGEPINLGPNVNSENECYPAISPDELELYFHGSGSSTDLMRSTRASKDAPWGVPGVFTGLGNPACDLDLSADGLTVYFDSDRLGGNGGWDIWMATRETVNAPWGEPVNLGSNINNAGNQSSPSISNDGLSLFYNNGGLNRISVTLRATTDDPWGPPVLLGPAVNGQSWNHGAEISPDGSVLYFDSGRSGGFNGENFWQVTFTPILDFDADGKVDGTDMAILAADWGLKQPLCDIAPLPWGDGVVNEKDLGVLMEALVTPSPRATDIPCDVVLRWASSFFAQSHDVYLGTSYEAVSNASRDNRLDVMVSQGQAATAYDPPGMLEFSKTYYWRVDFVRPSPFFFVFKGPVLDFTIEPFAHPVTNILATASSAQAGMGPGKTVDGSGLNKSDGHSIDGKDMWLSAGVLPNWIQFEFDKVYALQELWVWNSNQMVEPFMGFGAKTVKIEHSTDGTTWTPLANVPEFARAPGQSGYVHDTTISFGGVSAKYVKLTIEKGWGTTPSVGLSEVRFFYIPDRPARKP